MRLRPTRDLTWVSNRAGHRRHLLCGFLLAVALVLTACSSGPHDSTSATKQTSTTRSAVPHGQGTTTTTTAPPVTTTTIPSSAVVEGLTWISDTHGWALTVPSGCSATGCVSTVMTTLNGGQSWVAVGSIPDGHNTVPVTDIRFANSNDGYAYSPDFYETTDGGVTWTQVPGPEVISLEVAGSNVIRLSSSDSGCPGPCGIQIESAPIGSETWKALYSYPSDMEVGGVQMVLWAPDDIYVVTFENPAGGAPNAQSSLLISHDGGATWSQHADPCGYSGTTENDTAAIAAAADDVVAVICVPRYDGTDFVDVSGDGGASFAPSAPLPAGSQFKLLAVTSAEDIFAGTYADSGSTNVLVASHDRGTSWQQVGNEPASAPSQYGYQGFLGFESPDVGRWIANPLSIWTTTNGGYLWSQQQL
jgi:photosystem II stability/assembly factor-like uncharacterized protein